MVTSTQDNSINTTASTATTNNTTTNVGTTSPHKTSFTIGTRKSQLALVQTYIVRDQLQAIYPQYEFKIETMSTTGDKILNQSLSKIGEKALFTKELETALENGTVDLVVHSLKDLPTVLPPGMMLGAITERENPNDALVLNKKCEGLTLATLPEGSVIGTSSLRRVAQLKRRYPHLSFQDVRGNLNTRLAKLDDENGPYSGIILAVAGLVRLGQENRISHILTSSDSLYAVSQGALGIECREDDQQVKNLLEALNHNDTRICCLCERALMRTLEGGCTVPIGVNTKLDREKNTLWLHGLVASLDGKTVIEHQDEVDLTAAEEEEKEAATSTTEENINDTNERTRRLRIRREKLAEQLGRHVANTLIQNGADKILEELAHR